MDGDVLWKGTGRSVKTARSFASNASYARRMDAKHG